jgi:hypothetical protein
VRVEGVGRFEGEVRVRVRFGSVFSVFLDSGSIDGRRRTRCRTED